MARPIDYLLGNNIDKRTGLPMGVIGGNPSYMPSRVKMSALPQVGNGQAYNQDIAMRSGNPIPVRPMTNAGVIQNTPFKNNAPTLLTGTNTGQANTGLLGSSFNDPRSVGNFALASNLLQNSGYSTTPKTTGEIIGSGMGAYMKGRMAQEDRLSAKSQNSLKNQLEMAKYMNDLQKMKLDQQNIEKEDSKTSFTQEKDLRKEFTGLAKPFRETITNFNKAYAFAMKKNPTGASDIALVFSFMKALDPRSVVRENEQATTENAGGVPAYIRNFYNKLATGQKFDPVVREEIIDASRSLVVGQVQSQKDLENEYKGYAERNKLSVDNVYTSLLPKSGTYLNPIKVSSTDEAEEKLKDGQFFVLPNGSIGDIQ
tara:strand:+ start:9406 stop:10515 length:1110 start_codon:yes stop_codon:yes gene_type:complete